MNIKKNEHSPLEKISNKSLIKNNKNMPDSRNKKISFKNINYVKGSSTIHSDNTLTELTDKTISSKDIKPRKRNRLMRRKKRKQLTIFQPKNDDKFILYDILFYSQNKKIDFDTIREFIIIIQRKVNYEYASNLWEISNANDDNNKIKKLESLIARYSIVIYYLYQNDKIEEAKNLFLLLIKENISYIDYHYFKIFKLFNKIKQKYEILKVYPKVTKELFNIYSFIIKYCALFHFTKYKNKFLVRYLSLLSLNYKIFKRKMEIHGFSIETKNQIKYWFGISLHYASYFTLNLYCPLKIPISLLGLILKLYRNLDDNLSTRQEKSLIISSSYNQAFLYYINNQSDQALRAFKLTKQKIISFQENNYNDFNNVNKVIQFVDNSKINSTSSINNKNNNTVQKNSSAQNYLLGLNTKELLFNKKLRNHSFNSSNDFVEQIFINEGNRKKSLNMEEISDIFLLNLNENGSFIDNPEDNSFLGKKYSINFPSIRGSQTDVDRFLKMKEFNIPQYLKEPLFLNIELLTTEIEIDRKNYNLAYGHIKNCIILILIIKQLGENKPNKQYQRELCILLEYLEILEKYNKDKKLLSQIKSLQNLSLNMKNEGEKRLKKSSKLGYIIKEKKEDILLDNEKMKISKEIEKFFIFLNSLSMYQIKLLNDTQPTNDNRNDLPIFFHNQFKDTLSTIQRIDLEKLNIMSLSRCAILNEPDNYILPSNLNFTNIIEKINKIKKKKTNFKNNIQISFNGSLMNNDHIFNNYNNNEQKKELEEEEEDIFKYKGTKEFEYYKKIIFSRNCNYDLRTFLFNNFIYAITILKSSEQKEIEDMIEYPQIIVKPIKRFKKNNKNKAQYIDENKEEILKQLSSLPEFKNLFNTKFYLNNKDNKKKSKSLANHSSSNESIYSVSNFIQIDGKNNEKEE